MKFGYIDFDRTVNWYWDNSWNNKALLNIGDAAEYKVIRQLYGKLGIPDEKTLPLCISELTSYRGEKLIVALNISLDSYVGYNRILEELSPDIVPVFLGMCFTDSNLTPKQIECLKRFSPIGCRDQRSYDLMQKLGIESYLNGCTASCIALPKCSEKNNDRILFIDVPEAAAECIPESVKGEIQFLSQEIYCRRSDMPADFVPSKWAESIFQEYAAGARMIVTSRFHGAVLALAENIPAAITLERMTFRFSWIKNHLPIFTEGEYDQINWNMPDVDYTPVRKLVEKIALRRIRDTVEKYGDLLELTDIQRTDSKTEQGRTNQTLYFQKAWEQIKTSWNREKSVRYAFWGLNDNAENLYRLISEEFPKAQLVDIYDMFRTVTFKGITSVKPEELKKHIGDNEFYLIITAYLAVRVAGDICESIGFSDDRIIKCERLFVTEKDL